MADETSEVPTAADEVSTGRVPFAASAPMATLAAGREADMGCPPDWRDYKLWGSPK